MDSTHKAKYLQVLKACYDPDGDLITFFTHCYDEDYFADLIQVCKNKDERLVKLIEALNQWPKSSAVVMMAVDPDYARTLTSKRFSDVKTRDDVLTAIFEI